MSRGQRRRTTLGAAPVLSDGQPFRATPTIPATLPASSGQNLTNLNASALTSGTVPLARLVGLTNAQLDAAAAIDWTKVNKAGSSLADLITRSAGDLSSGTLPDARLSARVPFDDVAEAISGVWDFSNGLKERGLTAKIGEWTAVAHNAADYTTGVGSWTVEAADLLAFAYMRIGKTLFVVLRIDSSSITTGGQRLRATIPGGYTCQTSIIAKGVLATETGLLVDAFISVSAGGTTIDVFKDDGTNWANSTNNCNVNLSVFFEIQ